MTEPSGGEPSPPADPMHAARLHDLWGTRHPARLPRAAAWNIEELHGRAARHRAEHDRHMGRARAAIAQGARARALAFAAEARVRLGIEFNRLRYWRGLGRENAHG